MWKDYKFSVSDSYTGESVKIDNMWQVLEPQQELLKSLGVWEILEKAVEHNSMVKAYFQMRNQENARIEVGALKVARSVSDTAYQQMVEILDAMDVVTPGTVHPAIVRQLNELTDYYKQYYLSRKSSGSKKKDDGGEDVPEGEDVAPDDAATVNPDDGE